MVPANYTFIATHLARVRAAGGNSLIPPRRGAWKIIQRVEDVSQPLMAPGLHPSHSPVADIFVSHLPQICGELLSRGPIVGICTTKRLTRRRTRLALALLFGPGDFVQPMSLALWLIQHPKPLICLVFVFWIVGAKITPRKSRKPNNGGVALAPELCPASEWKREVLASLLGCR